MYETILSTVKQVCDFLELHSETNEFLAVFLGAILGGLVTIITSKKSIRKQCQFDMQFDILEEAYKRISGISKDIEMLGQHRAIDLQR